MEKLQKFRMMFTTLFIIGLVGILSLHFLIKNSLENYFAFTVILAIVMLPRILLEFFMLDINLDKNVYWAVIKFLFFLMILSYTSGYLFPKIDGYLAIVRVTVMFTLIFWGRAYFRKHKTKEIDSND